MYTHKHTHTHAHAQSCTMTQVLVAVNALTCKPGDDFCASLYESVTNIRVPCNIPFILLVSTTHRHFSVPTWNSNSWDRILNYHSCSLVSQTYVLFVREGKRTATRPTSAELP